MQILTTSPLKCRSLSVIKKSKEFTKGEFYKIFKLKSNGKRVIKMSTVLNCSIQGIYLQVFLRTNDIDQ